MKSFLHPLFILALVSFITHILWETAHVPLYTGYETIGHGLPVTFYVTLGDIAYTIGAVLFVSFFKHTPNWLSHATTKDYIGLTVLGFFIALFVEYKALALHRWTYAPAMPLIFGIGISPLLQMTILLPLSVYLTKVFIHKKTA